MLVRVTPIDSYLTELAGRLRGPHRARADLLAEARDGLVDAAEAHEAAGAAPELAARLAVVEFGSVPEIAPAYQRVLGFAQARRTALLVFLLSAAQSLMSTFAWRYAGLGWTSDPGPLVHLTAFLFDWVGVVLKVLALLLLVLCGVGVRYLGARRWIPRLTGYGALAVCLFSLVAAVFLTSGFSAAELFAPLRLLVYGSIVVVPICLAGWSAGRCLRTA